MRKAAGERNEVVGFFYVARRRYDINNIRARLATTSESWIAVGFFVQNLQRFFKGLLCVLKFLFKTIAANLRTLDYMNFERVINKICQTRELEKFSLV